MSIPSPAAFGVADAFVTKPLLLPGHEPQFMVYSIAGSQGVLPAGAVLGLATSGGNSGKLVLSASAAGDGSQSPMAVLPWPLDTGSAAVSQAVYVRGKFNANALTFGTGNTIANCKEIMRAAGLLTETPAYSG